MLPKFLCDYVLCSFKCNVRDEQCITWRALLVPIRFGAVFITSSSTSISTWGREVNVDGTIVNGGSMQLLLCFGCAGRTDELDVSESIIRSIYRSKYSNQRGVRTLLSDRCSCPK